MTKLVYLKLFSIDFEVMVEYEDNAVCGVISVSVDGHPVKCNTEEFYKALDGELQEALEEAINSDKIAYAEMQMDALREEGLH